MRGHSLFGSDKFGCTTCRSGSKLTNNKSYDVGTTDAGELLQVPSLRGVGYRAPFLHDGCAETLRDRFDPSCGGARHGKVADMSDKQTDDLVAHLRSR
jgi:cytochrome c peroxidase